MRDKMLEERRRWILEFMEKYDFSAVPNSAKEFYERLKVKPPLSPEDEELERMLSELKAKEKKKKKDAKKAGKKGKKAKLSERDQFLKERTCVGPTEAV